MKNDAMPPKHKKSKFVKDKYFKPYTQPNMVDVAQEMLCDENLTEEGFLGAQAVLLLNGLL